MVRHFPHPSARREDASEIALPLRRVHAVPEAPHRCGVEHGLDATADAARGFGLLRPDRIAHLHNKPDVDRRNGQFAQNRVDVGGKGIAPLLPMLCVAPARFVSADELLGHLPESAPLGHGESLRLPLSGFAIERVYPLPALVPVLCSFSACLS
jgi:hypothetical protein